MRWGRSLGSRILASFVLLACLFVVTGTMLLLNLGSLHSQVSAVRSQDLAPLSHLREAQNAVNGAAISGFAAAQTNDAASRKTLLDGITTYTETTDKAFTALVATAPAELRGQAQDVVATYTKFTEADHAYKAGASTAQAR